MSDAQISVVIGYRNWGVERLLLAIEHLFRSFGDIKGEVIVSDYGSDTYLDTMALAEKLGAE